jgi:hypothetical protein
MIKSPRAWWCRVIVCCLQRGRCVCAFPGSWATDNQRSEARGKHPTNRAVASSLQAGTRHGPALLLLHAIARTTLAACTKRSFIFLVAVVASMMRSGPCSASCIRIRAGGTRRPSVGDAGASATHAVTAPATQTTPTTRDAKAFLSFCFP